MTRPILHHYARSPYSAKLRAILGFKGLDWDSVEIPAVLPKPDLVALTGGYRRAPVLQLGRDLYCDSRLAARVLDRLAPAPPLLPPALKASVAAFAALEQTLFFGAVATTLQPPGMKALLEAFGPAALEGFFKDRAALFEGGTARRPGPEFGTLHFLPLLNALDQQLAASPFLLGEQASLADFIAWHPVWYVRANPGVRACVEPFRAVLAWSERIEAFGEGRPAALSADAALELARATPADQPFDGPLLLPGTLALGQAVAVHATDYGVDPVEGRLVHASVFELAIRREDPRAGTVTVHFPREGYAVSAR